ncbi:hypothetical protein Tco_0325199 [Tanacetum coccineum]
MIPPVFSPFYNNPCLKDVQAFYAKELPIPSPDPITPPAILTPSPILEIGKSSIKIHLKHHEEQIKDILNYLEELSFHRIGKMEEVSGTQLQQSKVLENPNKKTPTYLEFLAKTETYKSLLASNLLLSMSTKGAVGLIRWFERTESVFSRSNCAEENKVTFAYRYSLNDDALVPVKKMEDEFYNLVVKGNDLKTYIRKFQELAVLCPNMVPNTKKLMEVFISGLPKSIEGNVTASKPQTLEEATNIAQRLMDQIIRHDSVQEINNPN